MKFVSLSYGGYSVDLVHINQPENNQSKIAAGIDLRDFHENIEWYISSGDAVRNQNYHVCCIEPNVDLTFKITIKRKALFYTVNLIIPCVSISFLTILTFFLPSDCGEKISLCVNILLSLIVFFLLLSDLMPTTSLYVPLISKYLVFSMFLVTISIFATVCVLNIHFRSSTAHRVMSPWMRKLFFDILPKLLLMKQPHSDTHFLFKICNECKYDIEKLNKFEVKKTVKSKKSTKKLRETIRSIVKVWRLIKHENELKMVKFIF
jgi:nicotinic acetylcholine receptor, invertebrate